MKDVVSDCPIESVMRVLSGRWPTLLIYYLKDGSRRFSELRRDNPTVSHRMLSLELRKLETVGIVRRTDHLGYPRRVDYELTAEGTQLVPLIDALSDWWEETQAAREPLQEGSVSEAQLAGHPADFTADGQTVR